MDNFKPIKEELDMTAKELYFRDLKRKLEKQAKDPKYQEQQLEKKLKKSIEELRKRFNGNR
jgi:exonuclease VII large subunit